MDMKQIGSNLARLRKQNNYTQESLANELNISHQAVSKWETGGGMPEMSVIFMLAKLYGVSLDELLCHEVTPKDSLTFGGLQWRILDRKDGKALVITETTIGKAPYHDGHVNITWEHCNLRKYLNGAFCERFSETEKVNILTTTLTDRNNPWYDVPCGNPTDDKLFLLSYDEVIKYFGDSGDMQAKKGWCWGAGDKLIPAGKKSYLKYGDCINDQYNDTRKVLTATGAEDWWWLRSPGGQGSHTAGSIGYFGELFLCGDDVYRVDGGVRPAMWVTI